MKPTLSEQLTGLAEWFASQGMEHNAKMVKRAARIVAKHEKDK